MNDKKPKIIYLHGNNAKVDQQENITPKYCTYPITDNATNQNGCVLNKTDQDAVLAKEEVDDNKK